MKHTIIIELIEKPELKETWGALTEACKNHPELPYNILRKRKFPFEYKGARFTKVVYNRVNIDPLIL